MTLKLYRLSFCLLAACALVGLILVCYQHRNPTLENKAQSISRLNRSHRPRLQIQGFSYDANYKGQKALSIMANRFSIDKKKLGFFRFGLMNEARLENASIRIYARANLPATKAGGSQNKASSGQALTFNNVFSKEALPSFPTKRVYSIVMEPVSLEIRNEQSVVTQISASSAAIRLRNRDILFKGKVKVVAGSRILTTDRLTVIPDTAAIKTDRHFVLNTTEKQLEGNQLITDIFLNPISR